MALYGVGSRRARRGCPCVFNGLGWAGVWRPWFVEGCMRWGVACRRRASKISGLFVMMWACAGACVRA